MSSRLMGPFLFTVIILLPLVMRAEYRVFLLKIARTVGKETTERSLESTLDPEQYRYYFPLQPDEKISYIETWRCFGRTGGGLPHCPNPRQTSRTPASPTNIQNPTLNATSPP